MNRKQMDLTGICLLAALGLPLSAAPASGKKSIRIDAHYDVSFGSFSPWLGTWSIVRGTGSYAHLTGRGRWVGEGSATSPHSVSARYAGFATPGS